MITKCPCINCGVVFEFDPERVLSGSVGACPACGKETTFFDTFAEAKKAINGQLERARQTTFDRQTEAEKSLSALLKKRTPEISDEAKKALSELVSRNMPQELLITEIEKWWMEQFAVMHCQSGETRDLRKFSWPLVCAILRNDIDFFVRLGKELEKKPAHYYSAMEWRIALLWEDGFTEFHPPLKYFTDEALLEYLKIAFKNDHLTFDQVRKMRQRLGLQTKEIKITGIERKGKYFRYIWVDKNSS